MRYSLLLLLLLLLTHAPAAQPAPPPDLPTYTAWVREAAVAARRGDRLGLENAGGRLAAVTAVRAGDVALPVDNRWLAAELARPAPRMPLVAARLIALADTLAQPPSAAPPDAAARLRAILARPPFARAAPQMPQWWADFWSWLGRAIEALLRPVASTPPEVATATAWIVAIGGALLLAGVLLYLLLGLRRGVARTARAAPPGPEDGLTARGAFDQAGDLARAGDSRSAVRYLYLAALLWLDERDLLRYDRALTNREYLDRVRDNPALQRRLAPIVATFDRVWYGHAPLSREELAQFTQDIERLRSEL